MAHKIGVQVGGSSLKAELAALSLRPRPPAILNPEFLARCERARELMLRHGVDALLVGASASLRYFCGVAWSQSERLVALILRVRGEPIFVCPTFETGSALASLAIPADVRTWEEDEDPYALALQALGEGGGAVAVDPLLPFGMAEGLREASARRFVSGAMIIDGCRAIKSPAELAILSHAKSLTLEVQRRVAVGLDEGVTTTQIARFIDDAHRALGADGAATFCIVQFAEATAFPHGVPGEQRLRQGDVVLVDTGCTVEGYNADITRTYVFGTATDDLRRVWDLEKAAQRAAFEAVSPGVPCEAIDAAARKVIEDAGMGPGYRLPGAPARTGHGIGLSIHEGPHLVRGERTPLAPGMCFSNEPMIVVPGAFGVRLEDHFHVTEEGAAWFTTPSPSLDQPFHAAG